MDDPLLVGMLHLFSASPELLLYGEEHYRPRSNDTSTLLYQLLKAYSEDPTMSDTLREFYRQSIDQLLASLPPEELRKRLSAEERLKGLPPEERLKGLSAEEVVQAFSPEERLKGLSAAEVVQALSPEMREALARQLKANGSASQEQ